MAFVKFGKKEPKKSKFKKCSRCGTTSILASCPYCQIKL